MTGAWDLDAALGGIEGLMQAALPHRVVQRSLVRDPLSHDQAALEKGVICLVNGGGGQFANYRGREARLGHAALGVVGFVLVEETAEPVAVEQAELALLQDLLGWLQAPGHPRPFDYAAAKEFRQSRQMEFPYGWIVLEVDVKP